MSTTRAPRRVTWLVRAIVMLLPVFPAAVVMAEGKGDPNRPIEVTFTKWRTAVLPPSGVQTRSLFKGIVDGDLGTGDFVAEVLGRQASTPCADTVPPCTSDIPVTASIAALHAIYEVQVGEHSFTALIQGGTNVVTGAALLDGVILAGWRTGAKVQVEFQTIPGTTGCVGAPLGLTCFQGTIRVGRVPR